MAAVLQTMVSMKPYRRASSAFIASSLERISSSPLRLVTLLRSTRRVIISWCCLRTILLSSYTKPFALGIDPFVLDGVVMDDCDWWFWVDRLRIMDSESFESRKAYLVSQPWRAMNAHDMVSFAHQPNDADRGNIGTHEKECFRPPDVHLGNQ